MTNAVTIVTSGMVSLKAGAKCTSFSEEDCETNFILPAESLVCNVARYNYVSNWSSLTSAAKCLVQEVVGNVAAIYAIQYDMSKFTSRVEAEDMINVLRDGALRGLSLVRDKKQQEWEQSQ